MDSAEASGSFMEHFQFSWYDYIFFSLMLCLSAAIGVYFGFIEKKQTCAKEYLLGGKEMKIVPIAISLIASNISGITLMAVPSDVYRFGSHYAVYTLNMLPAILVTYYVFLPVFYNLQLTSTYEYLKLRFSGKIRIISSFLNIIANLLFLPIVIYIPALAFSQATGLNIHFVTPLVCGVCIFYTTIGGLKAVVWTDTLQFIAMIGSILAVFYIGIVSVGGFDEMWKKSSQTQRVQMDFDMDPTKRDTFPATLIGTFFGALSYIAVGQGFVQKYLSMPNMKSVKISLFLFAFGNGAIIVFSVITGLIMYARYADCDPFSAGKIKEHDQILPYYVMDVSRNVPGLSGLFMSGIFSAALSTLSASMNCLSASVYEDFVKPFMPENISQRTVSNILKLIVFIVGLISTLMVFVVEHLGAVVPIQFSLSGITSGPLLGLFVLGMLFPMANSTGALVGCIGSLVIMSVTVIGTQINHFATKHNYVPKLISVAGCDSVLNATITDFNASFDEEQIFFIFRITYYYYICMGTLLVLLIGIPVSLFTAEKHVLGVSKDLISPVSHWMMKEDKAEQPMYYDLQKALNVTYPINEKTSPL